MGFIQNLLRAPNALWQPAFDASRSAETKDAGAEPGAVFQACTVRLRSYLRRLAKTIPAGLTGGTVGLQMQYILSHFTAATATLSRTEVLEQAVLTSTVLSHLRTAGLIALLRFQSDISAGRITAELQILLTLLRPASGSLGHRHTPCAAVQYCCQDT